MSITPICKPHVTAAAVFEREGRFLLVEEEFEDGLRHSQAAGHPDPGGTFLAAAGHEAVEGDDLAAHRNPLELPRGEPE